MHELFTDFKIVYDSFRREVLYNIIFDFGIPVKLVRLRKYIWMKTTRVRVGKILSDMFHIKNGLKEEDVLSLLLFNFALEYVIQSVR